MLETLSSYLGGAVGVFFIVLFFGGSIFVHELGHFLAARKRGLKIERFSIGFGPRLFGWTGKDGVDYRVSLLPLGGYVALPQLADMEALEGDSQTDPAELRPLSYTDKLVVLSAGVIFNIIFAFALACVLWVTGRPVPPNFTTTTIGSVATELATAPGKPAPAFAAGLLPGDKILAVDDSPVSDFTQIVNKISLGGGRDPNGNPQVALRIERGGKELDIIVKPELRTFNSVSGDRARTIGIGPAGEIIIGNPEPGSPAAGAGLQQGDTLLALDGVKLWSFEHLLQLLSNESKPAPTPPPATATPAANADTTATALAAPADTNAAPPTLTTPAAPAPAATPAEVRLAVRSDAGVERVATLTPVFRTRTADLVEISFKDKSGARGTLSLVSVPDNALAKKAPATNAPRRNLLIVDADALPKDSPFAKVLRPGNFLHSIEQPAGFLRVRTPADLLDAAKNVKNNTPTTVIFSETEKDDAPGESLVLEGFAANDAPAKKVLFLGVSHATKATIIHQNPLAQIASVFRLTFDSLRALVNRNTDVGPNQLMGVISIAKTYLGADTLPQIIWFTILINISLAILNILPIPVLDGGHIVLATLQKLRGKPLPVGIHAGIHYIFMLLILLAMGYVLVNDVKRWTGDNITDIRRLIYQRYILAKPTPAPTPTPTPTPAAPTPPASASASAAPPPAPTSAQ